MDSYQIVSCDKNIFRAYDIRGLVDVQLNNNVYFTIGCAIAQILKKLHKNKIILAWDGRLTSHDYAQALEQGLMLHDIEVTRLGVVPTSLMYYATFKHNIDCGLMVTGSHNPKEYNGIKIVLSGHTARQEQITEILEVCNQLPIISTGPIIGKARTIDIITPYVEEILADISLSRPLKVVADFGHGVGGIVGPQLFSQLGCELTSLFASVDGTFPAHHPDPTIPTNLIDLQEALRHHQADVGLAFDGDADRLGVVTASGEIVWPDRVMMILARDVLKRMPGAPIVYDVKCSKQLHDAIITAGGRAIMSPTGHSLVKGIMREESAALAGEMSGHIFFKERWYGFDDGIYSACRLLEILSQYPSSQALFDTLPPTPSSTPEIKIDIADDEKFQFMENFSNLACFADSDMVTIDGMRIEFKDGWGLLRASNTSPCLVARFEASSDAALLAIQQRFKEEILKIDASLHLPF